MINDSLLIRRLCPFIKGSGNKHQIKVANKPVIYKLAIKMP
jgi:hypothetical protein